VARCCAAVLWQWVYAGDEETTVKTIRMMLMVGAVLSVMAGCTHTFEVVVHNPSDKALAVKAAGPGIGVTRLGTSSPKATFKGEVTLDNDDLPANVQISVGEQSKICKVTEDTEQVILRISLDGDKLLRVGKDPIHVEKKIDVKKPIGDPEEVIE